MINADQRKLLQEAAEALRAGQVRQRVDVLPEGSWRRESREEENRLVDLADALERWADQPSTDLQTPLRSLQGALHDVRHEREHGGGGNDLDYANEAVEDWAEAVVGAAVSAGIIERDHPRAVRA